MDAALRRCQWRMMVPLGGGDVQEVFPPHPPMAEVFNRPRCPAGLHSRARLRFQAAGLGWYHPGGMRGHGGFRWMVQFLTIWTVGCNAASVSGVRWYDNQGAFLIRFRMMSCASLRSI